MSQRAVLDLPPEVIHMILDCIEEEPDKMISLERRAYLSQESFRLHPTPDHDQAQNIANFRLVCRTFAGLGAVHQFSRVTTRFSRVGFERLKRIAGDGNVAKHVRKFTLMVPYFYVEGRDHVDAVLPDLHQTVGFVDTDSFTRKIADQRHLVQSQEDERVITTAIAAFTSLQHIQLLRVQDRNDAALFGYIRQNQHLTNLVQLDWATACAHTTGLLGAAIVSTGSSCSRFSSPMLSLSPYHSSLNNASQVANFARRLTSLELHFDDSHDLESRITELAPLFNSVFLAATQLRALHLGFPSQRPLDLGLERIFHHVKWPYLSAFGIQAWKLHMEEIIAIAQRHRDTLRGLRLRDVLLREASRWRDVLAYLRENMPLLDWVSLRRIGYARHFEEQMGAAGAEVPDDPPEAASDSDSDEVVEPLLDLQSDEPGMDIHSEASDGENSSEAESETGDREDDEFGPQALEMSFPESTLISDPQIPWCTCDAPGTSPANAEDLGDNGLFVTNVQRKQWEQWVIRRCPVHRT